MLCVFNIICLYAYYNFKCFIIKEFFTACVIHSLEYIHSQNIIHRDIKPENLVLDKRGYLRITDFGIAREYAKDNFNDNSGTPGYMAPEVMCSYNHSYSVDFFALGVILFEMIQGKRPYIGKTRKEIKEKIISAQAYLKLSNPEYSDDMINFTNLVSNI